MSRVTGARVVLQKVGRDLWAKGLSDCAIAALIGCHPKEVWRWRNKKGLEPNGCTAKTGATARLERVGLDMLKNEMTDPEIAAAVGCSKSSVIRWRQLHHLPPSAPHGSELRLTKRVSTHEGQLLVMDLWEKGLTDIEAGRQMGITRAAFSQRRRRLCLPRNRKGVGCDRSGMVEY
jgi:hypothetical protein